MNRTYRVGSLVSSHSDYTKTPELLWLEDNFTVQCVTAGLGICQMLFIAQPGSSLTALITLTALAF